MRNRLLFCMCFCSVMLAAQQPGQRFPNRPRIFPRNQGQESQTDQPEMQQGRQQRQPVMEIPVIDSDGDGKKSDQEIYEAAQKFLDQLRERNQQRFKKIMQRFDLDKDQQISKSETMEMYKELTERFRPGRGEDGPGPGERPLPGDSHGGGQPERPAPQPGSPPNLDLDGDGRISEQEIYAAVQGNLNDERVRNPQHYNMIMQRFDSDKDQNISFEEAMEIHKEHERRMQQGMQQGVEPQGERPLSDNGLLKGIKIEGLNLSSGR